MSNDILDWYVKYSSANLTVIQIMKRPESSPHEMFNRRSYMYIIVHRFACDHLCSLMCRHIAGQHNDCVIVPTTP